MHPVDAMQSEPWNADLIDYLADFLVKNDYDLRKLLSHIATSEAYQSKSEVLDGKSESVGYQYRGPRAKRLTSEQFVDAVWTLTGRLPRSTMPLFCAVELTKRMLQMRYRPENGFGLS